jgi:hypothetical protein
MKEFTAVAQEEWELVLDAEKALNATWTEIKSIRTQLEDKSITNLKQRSLQPRLEELLSDAVHKDRTVMEAVDAAKPSEDAAFAKAEEAQQASTNLKAALKHRRAMNRFSTAMNLEKRRVFRLTYGYSIRALVFSNKSHTRALNETVAALGEIEGLLRGIIQIDNGAVSEDVNSELEVSSTELQVHEEEVSGSSKHRQQVLEQQLAQKDAAKKAMLAHNMAVRTKKPAEEVDKAASAKAAAVVALKAASIELFKATKAYNQTVNALDLKKKSHTAIQTRANAADSQTNNLAKLADQLVALAADATKDDGVTFNLTELSVPVEESDKKHQMEASGWSLLDNATVEFNKTGGVAATLETEAVTGLALVVTTLEKKFHELAHEHQAAQLNLSEATEAAAAHTEAHEQLTTEASLHQRRHQEAVKGLSDCQCDPLHAVPTITLGAEVSLHSRKQLVLGSSNDIGVMLADGALQLHSGQSLTVLSEMLNPSKKLTTLSADEQGDGDGTVTITGKLDTKGKVAMMGSDLDLTSQIVSPESISVSVTRTNLEVMVGDGPEKEGEARMQISASELSQLKCGGLQIGGVLAGTIRVHNISNAVSKSITGPTTLTAPTLGAQVVFAGASSSFYGLDVSADNGIVLEHNLTALNGSATLNGNLNNVSQARGTVVIHDGVALTAAAGELKLGRAAGLNASMSALGRAFLSATEGIHMHHSLVSVGIPGMKPVELIADADGKGKGAFVIDEGCKLDSNSNNLTITAKEVEINGWLDSAAAPMIVQNSFRGQTFGLGGSQRPILREQKEMFGSVMIQTTRMDLYVSNAQLARIRATGLQFGSVTSGLMLVDGVDETNATGVGMMTLYSGVSEVKFINAESSFTKGLTVHALNGVKMEQKVKSKGAPVLLNGGIGTIQIDKKMGLDTGGELLTIATDNVAINGKVDTGDALVVLNCYTAGRSIGLGSDDSSQMVMTGPEMQNLHSGGLIMGGNCGSMVVAGVKEKHSNNVKGIVRLLATSLHEKIIKEETAKYYNRQVEEDTPASGESLSVVEDLEVESVQMDVNDVAVTKQAAMAVTRDYDTTTKPSNDVFSNPETPHVASDLSQAEADLAGAEAEFDSAEDDEENTREMFEKAGLKYNPGMEIVGN